MRRGRGGEEGEEGESVVNEYVYHECMNAAVNK